MDTQKAIQIQLVESSLFSYFPYQYSDSIKLQWTDNFVYHFFIDLYEVCHSQFGKFIQLHLSKYFRSRNVRENK